MKILREEELKKAEKEVQIYKSLLECIENKIEETNPENRGTLFRELLDCDLKLKTAKLEFFNMMDILCC